jgi:protein-tyrosine phosphatase
MSDTATERERLVHFEKAPNFRDLGGYPSRFGGTTRWGRVYRAAALHEMTPADLDRLAGLGIETIYDLRSNLEYDEHPDPVPSINVPVLGRFMAENERPDFGAMIEHDHGVDFMRGMTMNMLHWGAVEIGSVITGLADVDRLPAVFHCTVGKDRTGIVAALLLRLAGVSLEDAADDYALSSANLEPRWRRWVEDAPDEAERARRIRFSSTPASAMAGLLEALEREHGSVAAYLRAKGLSERTVARARGRLRP